MSASVGIARRGEVAVVRLSNPPLDALDGALRARLDAALDALAAETDLRAVVLAGGGRRFCAGPPLDPSEPPEAAPTLARLTGRIEDFPVPVVAALSGPCLGAGAALALAAAARVADPGARIGFPEVTLGLVPRGGATQRLTRLVGAAAALEMLLSGTAVTAARAAELGLVDRLAAGAAQGGAGADGADGADGPDGAVIAAAVELAREIAAGRVPRRRAAERRDRLADGAAHLDEVAVARRATEGGRLTAARRIVDCVEAAALLPWEAALAYEAAAFEDCAATDESRALRHVFRAELGADLARRGAARAARRIRALGIVGRSGAALALAWRARLRGLSVRLLSDPGAAPELAEALAEARRRIPAAAAAEGLAPPELTEDPSALMATDALVVAGAGAAGPGLAALHDLARQLPPEMAVLALVEGDHGAGPAAPASPGGATPVAVRLSPNGRLAELILPAAVEDAGEEAAGEEAAGEEPAGEEPAGAAVAVCRALGLIAVPVRERAVSLSLRVALERAAGWLVEAGHRPAAVDGALRRAGYAQGPFAAIDAEGLEAALRRIEAVAPGRPPAPLLAALLARGRTGRAAGAGIYRHDPYAPPAEDATLSEVLAGLGGAAGVSRAGAATAAGDADTEILTRVELAMANAGARLLETGAVRSAAQVDLVAVHALGCPRWRGGPMMTAERMGVVTARKMLMRLAADDPELWDPAPLWLELFKRGLHPAEVSDRELVSDAALG